MNDRHSFPGTLVAAVGTLVLAGTLMAPTVKAQNPPAPDNSKMNQNDGSNGAITADQQKMNSTDQAMTKQIRAALMKDKALSTYAHNVKIVTQDGKVTLKGPVRSDDEKSSIEAKATAIAGAGNVTDDLTVAPPKS